MKSKVTTVLIWCGLVALFVALFSYTNEPEPTFVELGTLEQFIREERLSTMRIVQNELTFQLKGDKRSSYVSYGALDEDSITALYDQDIPVTWEEKSNLAKTLVVYVVPLVLLLGLFVYFAKRQGGGVQNNIFTLRKSRARVLQNSDAARFDRVGGNSDAKEQLADVIDFLKQPDHWNSAGARLPRGILLEGPPGCGKTLLARAVAGETEAKFYTVAGSEFVELFVGVGAARVRDMFEEARKAAPAVIFIDELDAVGRRRGSGVGSGHDEREQTLNQLLVCLDGFEANDRVVVIAATNRSDVLDKALLRPGRFDRRITIEPADEAARREILGIHTANKKLSEEISLEALAQRTDGFVGAGLETLCNDAALLAVRRQRGNGNGEVVISQGDFEAAIEKVMSQRKLFSGVDAVLIESAGQLAEPLGIASVRLEFEDGSEVVGRILWADAAFLKIVRDDDGAELVVPKIQIKLLETLSGSTRIAADKIQGDPWAARIPEMG